MAFSVRFHKTVFSTLKRLTGTKLVMHWERLSATRRVLSSEAARETHTKVKLEINSQVIKSPTNHILLKKTYTYKQGSA